MRRDGRERGAISLFAVVAVVALFIAIGLVVDGGGKMRASQRADAVAAAAGRAGGQAITTDVLVHGSLPLADATKAAAAAHAYLAEAGVEGTVQVDGDTITVATSVSYAPVFLSAVGVPTLTVTGQATVQLVSGL